MAKVRKHVIVRKPKGKKRVRKKPRSYKKLETLDMYEGDVQLFRTEPSGNVWQFQMWIAEEHKYFRKSTKKRDTDQAIVVAKEYYLDTQTKIRNQTPVFPHSAEELSNQFLDHIRKGVGHDLTPERLKTIETQIKHWLVFVGPDTKMNDIKKLQYEDYFTSRRKTNPEVVNSTLIAERGTIRRIYKWAIDRGMVHYSLMPEFPALRKQKSRRRLIDIEEYRTIYEHLKSDDFQKNCSSDDRVFRQQIRLLLLVLANTGMRLGECRRLRWDNIKKIYKEKGKSRAQWSVLIHLDGDQTKNRKERQVIGRRGDVFVDLRKLTDFTRPLDPVFADFHTGKPLLEDGKNGGSRHKIYNTWNNMLRVTGLSDHKEPCTFYHLRHFYATQRLKAGVTPFFLHESLGCSMKYLEEHYGHVNVEEVRTDLLKSAKYDDDGVLIIDA